MTRVTGSTVTANAFQMASDTVLELEAQQKFAQTAAAEASIKAEVRSKQALKRYYYLCIDNLILLVFDSFSKGYAAESHVT